MSDEIYIIISIMIPIFTILVGIIIYQNRKVTAYELMSERLLEEFENMHLTIKEIGIKLDKLIRKKK